MMSLRHDPAIFIFRIKEKVGHSVPFIKAICEAVEVSIVDDRLIESSMVLMNHLQLVVSLRASHQGSVSLMGMKYCFGSFSPNSLMHGPMKSDSCDVWTVWFSSQLIDSS